ncbi:MAG: hypothetical protein M1832_002002 [Thelocarpon impressellum]|nr:MAG: hypothetical protein M1832_002002 [Thelocarpon impressellum]
MDDMTQRLVENACIRFIMSIDRDAVCRLASSFNHGKPCRLVGKHKKGSFNVCFPVTFEPARGRQEVEDVEMQEEQQNDSPQWMVRFPILPRLAFPEEKLRGEIATMKYIAQHTSIPMPEIRGFGFGGDYPTGLPFLILEFVEGRPLVELKYNELEPPRKETLYRQLADIFVQLRQQKFGHVGALTLDANGDPTFARHRPLGIDFNDGQLDGQDPASLLGPHDVFTSAKGYIRFLTQMAITTFCASVISQLYALHRMRDYLSSWSHSSYAGGPFVLMHGDLLPGNVIVYDNLRICAILDWEWSHTVPLQCLAPPFWLSGVPLEQIFYKNRLPGITQAWAELAEQVRRVEVERPGPRLSQLWCHFGPGTVDSMLVAHSLHSLSHLTEVFRVHLNFRDAGHAARFKRFFDPACNPAATDHGRLAAIKAQQRKRVQASVENVDRLLEEDYRLWSAALKRPRSPMPVMDDDDLRRLAVFMLPVQSRKL